MSRKRKFTRRTSPNYNTGGDQEYRDQTSIHHTLFIQAHEATIINDRPDLAEALTSHDHGSGKGGLIQWQGDGTSSGNEVWVDRYDARLLLTSLPNTKVPSKTREMPPSPTSWSDLPSDVEDTFFLSIDEIEDLRREKRRKLMDAGREERLRALQESDPDPDQDFEHEQEKWGDDDEEPDAAERIIMERTAKHLLTSPNPGQLEMRILANHGTDQHFAFLRGRWGNAWKAIKLVAKMEREAQSSKPAGGLVAYGSDSDDSDTRTKPSQEIDAVPLKAPSADEKEKEARRERAKEWIRKRKESRKEATE